MGDIRMKMLAKNCLTTFTVTGLQVITKEGLTHSFSPPPYDVRIASSLSALHNTVIMG